MPRNSAAPGPRYKKREAEGCTKGSGYGACTDRLDWAWVVMVVLVVVLVVLVRRGGACAAAAGGKRGPSGCLTGKAYSTPDERERTETGVCPWK